jgi:hypothetical protein
MYQRENNDRGCKVRNNKAKNASSATSFTIQPHGVSYAQRSLNSTLCASNAMELAKWLTTSFPSSKVVNRWRGTTFKQCVIDVTISSPARKHTNDDAKIYTGGGVKCKNQPQK